MRYPYHHNIAKERRILTLVIIATWVLPLAPAITSGLISNLDDIDKFYTFSKTVLFLLFFITCSVYVFIFMTYVTIVSSRAKQQPQQGREYTTLKTEQENNSPQQGRHYKSLKTERQNDYSRATDQGSIRFLLYLTLTYTVTVTPDYTLNLICIHHQELELELDHSVFVWTSLTFFMYTLYHTINPLLTCYYNRDFRAMLGKRRLGQQQHAENVVTDNNVDKNEETLA